jgi:hypothetical protein
VPKKQQPSASATPPPAEALASPYLSGNQSLSIPAGGPGKLVVVASGDLSHMVPNDPASSLDLPVVVRNNTSVTQSNIRISATAHDSSGKLVGTGRTDGSSVAPVSIKPGQVAIADVFFGPTPPASAQLTFNVTTERGASYQSFLVTESNVMPVGGEFVSNARSGNEPDSQGNDILT